MKQRLDQTLVNKNLVSSRSQSENYIKLGQVKVNGVVTKKTAFLVSDDDTIELTVADLYVSRAALKLASVVALFKLDFANTLVFDVGSSTGGFTDFALRHGATKVIAIDVGTQQLHPILRTDKRIELHEKTDIRSLAQPTKTPDIVLIDVSFISLREILPHVATLISPRARIVAMVKPQFETGSKAKHKGVIKNERIRRDILKAFEQWVATQDIVILDKADSQVSGAKGNQERFYLLKLATR